MNCECEELRQKLIAANKESEKEHKSNFWIGIRNDIRHMFGIETYEQRAGIAKLLYACSIAKKYLEVVCITESGKRCEKDK